MSNTESYAGLYERHDVYGGFGGELRTAGTIPATLIGVRQTPFEAIDPRTDEMVLGTLPRPAFGTMDADFGDGRRHIKYGRGDAFYLNCAVTDSTFRQNDEMEIVFVCAKWAGIAAMMGMEERVLTEAVAAHYRAPGTAQHVRQTMLWMWAQAADDDPASGLAIDHGLMSIAASLIALADPNRAPAPPPLPDDRRLARAIEYAETHICAPLTIGELAAVAAMSPSAFSRAFRLAMGEAPWAYVRRRRLERAGERMARTDETLAEIAAACGFADASHLARSWRRSFGTTPREGGR